jgi:hypothetical protein
MVATISSARALIGSPGGKSNRKGKDGRLVTKRLEIPGPHPNDNPAMQPPLLPAETLARLLRLAKLDGTSILVISGAFALVSAAMGDRLGALVALMVAGPPGPSNCMEPV